MAEDGVSLKKLQRQVIRTNLELAPTDRVKVVHRLEQAARKKQTRVTMFAVIKFEDGEVQIVPDMEEFVASFDHVHFGGTLRQITPDDFSIAMLGAGEDAYCQGMRLTKFLKATHQGWFMTVQEATATYRKPRNFWKRLANTFESYDKRYSDYRVIVDLSKTDDISNGPLIARERALLYDAHSSDTMVDAVSSGVFSREDKVRVPAITSVITRTGSVHSESLRKIIAVDVSEQSTTAREEDSISDDSDETPLDTSAKAMAAELKAEKEHKAVAMVPRHKRSGSMSSSSTKAPAIVIIPKAKGKTKNASSANSAESSSKSMKHKK
jgi:hypothetical protein